MRMSSPLTKSPPEVPSAGSSPVAGVPRGTSRHLADEVSAGGDDRHETGEAEERSDQEKPEVEQGCDPADNRELPVLPLDGHDPAQDRKGLRIDDGEDEERVRGRMVGGHVRNRGEGWGGSG